MESGFTKALYTLTLIMCSTLLKAYETPESAVYDPETESYYVSNFSGKRITKTDLDGNTETFVDNLSAPLGLLVSNSRLWTIDNPRWVKGFCLETGKNLFELEIPEAQFLNDITIGSDNTLYVTDSRAGYIYEIDPQSRDYQRLNEQPYPGANGILFDASDNRLIISTTEHPAKILEYELETKTIQVLLENNDLQNLDGITTDKNGNFYVSTWGAGSFSEGFGKQNGSIYQFDASFKGPPKVIFEGLWAPADIYYSIERQEFLIPLFFSNELEIVPFDKQ